MISMVARAWVVAGTTVALSVTASTLDIVDLNPVHLLAASGELIFMFVGLVVARAQPRNTVAWTFLASGLLNSINHFGESLATIGTRDRWPEFVKSFGGWCTGWTWVPALFVIITIGLLHFPTGGPISPRWQWVDKAALAAMGGWSLTVGIATAGLPSKVLLSNKTPNPTNWRAYFLYSGFFCVFALAPIVLLAAASLVVRWRRGSTVERLQIRWVAAAGTLAVLTEIILDVVGSTGATVGDTTQTLVESLSFGLVAVAAGTAIMRYHLFDLDRIFSRTLAYALLSVLLAGLYIGVVAGADAIVPKAYGSVGVAAATLAVAALFVPVRQRIQRVVDRRFNRARYDATRTIDRFAITIRTELSQGELCDQLLRTVRDAVAPTSASLWLVPAAGAVPGAPD